MGIFEVDRSLGAIPVWKVLVHSLRRPANLPKSETSFPSALGEVVHAAY